MNCPRCSADIPRGKSRCPACRAWVIDNDTPAATAASDLDEQSVCLADCVSVAKQRLDVGWLNPLFGGGIVLTSTCMIGGSPGAGKSTLIQQMWKMALMSYPTRKIISASAEECGGESRQRADRLGLTAEEQRRVMVVDAMAGNYNLIGAIAKHQPILVTIDSIQKYCGRHNYAAQEQLLAECKAIAVEYMCPFVIISQVNKDDDIAGANANQHETDANFVLTYDPDDIRYFDILKNRNGPSDVHLRMRMTARGLEPLPPEEEAT
jgi:DNA repair protein RadA/Sms